MDASVLVARPGSQTRFDSNRRYGLHSCVCPWLRKVAAMLCVQTAVSSDSPPSRHTHTHTHTHTHRACCNNFRTGAGMAQATPQLRRTALSITLCQLLKTNLHQLALQASVSHTPTPPQRASRYTAG